ncbi:hypothetical protein, partial [Bacillus cereus group sp. BC87]
GVEQAAQHLRDLPIVGERFAPADLMPKSVLLRKEHKEVNAEAFCCKFVGNGALGVLGRSTANGKIRPLYVDGTKLLGAPGFDVWLYRMLRQRTPASVHAIIHQNDEASRALALECAQRLTEIMMRLDQVPVISEAEIEVRAGEIGRD